MNGKPPSLENKAKSSQSIGPEPLAPGFFCLPARLRERAIRESPLRMGHGPRRVGAGVPDGPYVGQGRKTKKQVIRNTFVGATLAVARVGHGRKPGEHLIRLTAFGTFPSRGRQHLIRLASSGPAGHLPLKGKAAAGGRGNPAPTDQREKMRRGRVSRPVLDVVGRRGSTSSSASPHPALRATFPSRGRLQWEQAPALRTSQSIA